MEFTGMSCEEFVKVLASSAPVPGGGGASAFAGAIGTALGNMVGSLTVGKKKYAVVEEEMISLKEKCDQLQKELLALMQEDARVFEPLSLAYRMPKTTDEEAARRSQVMEKALKDATLVPLEIMRKCCEAIALMKVFAEKGSVMAVSDAGVGVSLCRGALKGASLNVFINTKSMTDREFAGQMNDEANGMLREYCPMADEIFEIVAGKLIELKSKPPSEMGEEAKP